MNATTQTEPAASPAPKRTPNIKAFGIGTAGLNLLDHLAREGVAPDALVAVHSDPAALTACPVAEKVQIEAKLLRRLGADADPDRSRVGAEEPAPRLKTLCAGADVVLLVAGFGGVAGTCLSPILAAAARESGAFVVCFVILPFDCEGSLRGEVARAGLKRLIEVADLVICLPNQKALALIDETTSLLDTFKGSNRLLGSCIHGLWRALASQSVIGLPFLDLCALIRQHSTACVFALAEASGPTRAAQAVERVLAHPLLDGPATLRQAAAMAVCILGGPSLAMAEVNRIMDQLHRQYNAAPILMGAAIVPDMGDALLVGLLLAQPEADADAPAADEGLGAEPSARGQGEDLSAQLLDGVETTRRHSRFVPPPPTLPPDKMAQLMKNHARSAGRVRKTSAKLRQGHLPLEIVSKGRFDKSEPTIHKGEDLDVPTYIRRGIALN